MSVFDNFLVESTRSPDINHRLSNMSENKYYWKRLNINHSTDQLSSHGKAGFKNISLTRKCLAEFLGTFIFVLILISTNLQAYIYQNGISFASITVGIALFLTIFMSAPISGGHLNPAITGALACTHWIDFVASDQKGSKWENRRHVMLRVLAYFGVQTLATFLAAGLAYLEFYDSIQQVLNQSAECRFSLFC